MAQHGTIWTMGWRIKTSQPSEVCLSCCNTERGLIGHERSTKSKQLGWEDDVNLGSAEIFIVPHWIWRMVAVAVGDVEQKRDHLRDLDVVSKISIWGLSTYEHRYHSMSLT